MQNQINYSFDIAQDSMSKFITIFKKLWKTLMVRTEMIKNVTRVVLEIMKLK